MILIYCCISCDECHAERKSLKNNVMVRVFNNQLYKDISGKTDGYFHNCSIVFKINIHVRSRSSVALNMHLCNNVFSENRWDFVYLF